MLKKLKTILGGSAPTLQTVPIEWLQAYAKKFYYDFIKDTENDGVAGVSYGWRYAAGDPDRVFQEWYTEFCEMLKPIGECASAREQAMECRAQTMWATRHFVFGSEYFSERYTDADRKNIRKAVSPEEDEMIYRHTQHNLWVHGDISTVVLRSISRNYFQDASTNDWWYLYLDSFKSSVEMEYRRFASEPGERDSLLEAIAQATREQIVGLQQDILSGANWDYAAIKAKEEAEKQERQGDHSRQG